MSTMALAPLIKQQWFNNGVPLSGGQLFCYQAGTSTPQNTYTDQSGVTPNTNPVILDVNGEANVWLDPSLSYKFVLQDASNNVLWTVDNVVGSLTPNAVTTNSIQNGAITLPKLSTTLAANNLLGANAAGTALEAKALTAGSNISITQSVGGIQISSPGSANLTEQFALSVPQIVVGEAIAANDAVCLDLARDSSNNVIYMVFKCNSTLANRRTNFVGFAIAAASVTQGVWTWAASANFVTNNVISYSINGRSYSTSFTTDNATTLAAIATQMATDPDVAGAVSDGVHTITVTGKGALYNNVTGSAVTGGASQATITYTNTTAPAGGSVAITAFGPMAGFTSLSTTTLYYLSSVSGGITNAPTDSAPVLVGQALSSSVLMVNYGTLNGAFSTSSLYVRSHGGTGGDNTTPVQDSEHFNFTSWSTGVAGSAGARTYIGGGDGSYNGFHMANDGFNSGGVVAAMFTQYNKSSWSTLANRSTPRDGFNSGAFNGFFYTTHGSTDGGSANFGSAADKWNGVAWASATSWSVARGYSASLVVSSLYNACAGLDTTGTAATGVSNRTTSDVIAAGTSIPAASSLGNGSGSSSLGVIASVANDSNTTASYTYNGTSWSSSITASYSQYSRLSTGAYSAGRASNVNNGGQTAGSSAVISSTQSFNGTSYNSATASATARGTRAASSVI